MRLRREATDDELLSFVEQWVDDLAQDDYDSAFARTSHDPYFAWTPALMRSVVTGYGSPEPHPRGPFAVTPRSDAQGQRGYRKVERESLPPGVVAEIWYDLPLNGEWSDLTATFRFEPDGNALRAYLEDIHVF